MLVDGPAEPRGVVPPGHQTGEVCGRKRPSAVQEAYLQELGCLGVGVEGVACELPFVHDGAGPGGEFGDEEPGRDEEVEEVEDLQAIQLVLDAGFSIVAPFVNDRLLVP